MELRLGDVAILSGEVRRRRRCLRDRSPAIPCPECCFWLLLATYPGRAAWRPRDLHPGLRKHPRGRSLILNSYFRIRPGASCDVGSEGDPAGSFTVPVMVPDGSDGYVRPASRVVSVRGGGARASDTEHGNLPEVKACPPEVQSVRAILLKRNVRRMMGVSRCGEREPGKSDGIDARAIARAVLREGRTLPERVPRMRAVAARGPR